VGRDGRTVIAPPDVTDKDGVLDLTPAMRKCEKTQYPLCPSNVELGGDSGLGEGAVVFAASGLIRQGLLYCFPLAVRRAKRLSAKAVPYGNSKCTMVTSPIGEMSSKERGCTQLAAPWQVWPASHQPEAFEA